MSQYRDAQANGNDDDCPPKFEPKYVIEQLEAVTGDDLSDYAIDLGGEG